MAWIHARCIATFMVKNLPRRDGSDHLFIDGLVRYLHTVALSNPAIAIRRNIA